ncbi:hypothetical protein BDR26DRAFT_1008623 [Obelidium mucronatum]|nr:hypothetical protein BDR26DRAFT_1008623 [Obelidium mucronatum]
MGKSDSIKGFVSSILLWSYLPRYATNWIMQLLVTPLLFKHLHPNDPRHRRNWKLVFSLVVGSYLLYTVLQTEHDLPPNFYTLMQTPLSRFNAKQLKTNYKALSLAYHPDKNPGFNDYYVVIVKAYEVLKDSKLRAIYDKFGIDVITSCTTCKTERDYMYRAFSSLFQFYFGTSVFLVLYSLLGQGGFGSYWRYLSLLSVFAVELILLVSAHDTLAKFLFPSRTTAERITILHQLFVVVSIAVAQVGPVWFPPKEDISNRRFAELDQFMNMNAGEAQLGFASAFAPFRDDSKLAGLLQRRMEKAVVDAGLLELNPALQERRNAWRNAKLKKQE